MMASTPFSLELHLRSRLLPLAFLLVFCVSVEAPVVYFVMSIKEYRSRSVISAQKVAIIVGHEIKRRPVLWRYDSVKVLEHLFVYQVQPDISRILVTDLDGVPIADSDASATDSWSFIWEHAPVVIGGEKVGQVWIAMSYKTILRESLWLMLISLALGLLLAGLLAKISLRTVSHAEHHILDLIDRLAQSREKLSQLNSSLEKQVEDRTSELSRTVKELNTQKGRFKNLSQRAIAFQETQRRAISRDLHDSAGQALTAVRIHLQLLSETSKTREEVQKLTSFACNITDSALEEVRRAVTQLSPAVLDELGLEAAIRRTVGDLAKVAGVQITYTFAGLPDELPPVVEIACYRIIQEAITNVLRHANADEVELKICQKEDTLYIEVCDNGKNALTPDTESEGHGLIGMRERAELLGGELIVKGRTSAGSRVIATIPVGDFCFVSDFSPNKRA